MPPTASGTTDQLGIAKVRGQPCLVPGCRQKKDSTGPPPYHQIDSPPQWSDIP